MINSIYANDNFLVVNNGYSSYPYISPGANGAGIIRWNSSMNCFEVNDGAVWQKIPSNDLSISLSDQTKQIIE